MEVSPFSSTSQPLSGPWSADVLLKAQNTALVRALDGAPLEEVLKLLALSTASQSGGRAAIFLVDEAGALLRYSASAGLPKEYTRAVDGFVIGPESPSCGNAAYTGERVIVGDVGRDPLWEPFLVLAKAHGIQACWSTPIRNFEGQVLGTLAVYHETPRVPLEIELEGIDLLAHNASILIGRAHAEAERAAALELAQANEVAAREMSHRVMNSFHVLQGLVAMQVQGAATDEVRTALGVLSGRLQAMAGMHRLLLKGLRENLETVDLAEYLTDLVETVGAAFISDESFTLAVYVEPGACLPSEQVSPVGLITTELVMNALKHACPEGGVCRIDVTLRRDGAFYRLCISDDGKGLPSGAEKPGKRGLGMRLLASLVGQLSGTLEIDRSSPGVSFVVTFAVSDPAPVH